MNDLYTFPNSSVSPALKDDVSTKYYISLRSECLFEVRHQRFYSLVMQVRGIQPTIFSGEATVVLLWSMKVRSSDSHRSSTFLLRDVMVFGSVQYSICNLI